MKNQSDIYFLKLLQDSINALNELDNLIDSNSSRQNEVDAELLDLLHLIENNELCDSACIKITRRIQELRKTRRRIKNEHELIVKYNEIKTKLSSKDNRQFITAEINKRMKLLNQEYKNRVLTDEQVKELLKNEKLDVKTDRSETYKKIKEYLELGYSQTKIAKLLGLTQPTISAKIKKMKEQPQC